MSAVSMVVGAVTDDGATFVAQVDGGGPVRVAVATDAAMSAPVYTSSEAVDAQGVAKVSITGLDADTRHHWQVEDNSVLDTGTTGQFRTFPTAGSQASFTVALSGDAGLTPVAPGSGSEAFPDRISNHPVFDTIRSRALSNDWLAFLHLGDILYYNFGGGSYAGDTLTDYRGGYDDLLDQSNQAALYREVPLVHIWDDHEFGPNDSDGTHTGKGNAAQVYREREPHYPLAESDAIYHSFRIGRVLFIMADVRYDRSPNGDTDDASKTMLGSAQKTWMDNLLATSDAEVLVWCMGSQWLGTSEDSWDSFQTERDELVQMFDDRGWLDRMIVAYGDHHGIGIDSGASNDWGGFPAFMAASLDATPSSTIDPSVAYDVLNDQPGREQYGTLTVTDIGSVITVRMTAWQGTTELGSYQVGFTTSTAPASFAGDMADIVYGSHRATFEARVLSRFQVGDDPDGTEIAIIDGDVHYDATGQVFATLDLTTDGMDERRRSRFPRTGDDLLAPYGTEVFVRRGVDIGSETIWVPLGYFRLDDAEQGGASDQPIRLSGADRMSGIIDAELVIPRQFDRTRTIGSVVAELVEDVYPSASIVFDDDSAQEDLGRQLLVERDRYSALLDIAESLGKVMYWDGEGVLRIEDAPDPDELVWDIRAGYHGVLVDAQRRVTREGMANGVVAIGEGGDTVTPVQAIAVDAGPNSPTRWYPPDDPDELWFGQVPHFYSSPLLTTDERVRAAASAQLHRRIGLPYQVDWGSVVNPALRPREAARITHKLGERERHLIDMLTIPLRSGRPMTGTTREQTQIVVDQLVTSAVTDGE